MVPQEKRTVAETATPEAAARDAHILARLSRLPASVGLVMMAAGVAIMPLPGPFGTPLIVCGGLVVAPRTFGKINDFGKRRFPKVRQQALEIVERFLNDMEKRYPPHKQADA
jgi:hypothetical protein